MSQVVALPSNTPISVSRFIDEQSSREIITAQVATPLRAGQQYKISIKFTAILNAQLRGFYRSSYVENGQTKWVESWSGKWRFIIVSLFEGTWPWRNMKRLMQEDPSRVLMSPRWRPLSAWLLAAKKLWRQPATCLSYGQSRCRLYICFHIRTIIHCKHNHRSGRPGYVWDVYQTSVKMSSYLVAAMVSEFIGIPADAGLSNVEFRIWARPDARPLTE